MIKKTEEVSLEVIKASEITPKAVTWLWYPYIPYGKITILEGNPGEGKSKLMLSIAALLTKGLPLPFADKTEETEPAAVIYQTTEDDADDTVVPRFLESGGDPERLIFIKEDAKRVSFGDKRIEQAIRKYDARLLVLDPMSSYIGSDISMNQANEMRDAMNPLVSVAQQTGCAIVIISHMNKMEGINPLYRTSGSIDIAGSARSILAVVKTNNQDDPDERVMVQVKSNLSRTGSAILFDVGEKNVSFIDEIELEAKDAFAALGPKVGRPSEKCDKAVQFIKEMLSDGEYHKASECIEQLKLAGFKESTYKKAKRILGVETDKISFDFLWRLPAERENDRLIESVSDVEDLPL